MELDETGLGTLSIAGFFSSGVEPRGYSTSELLWYY
jgi:hypothetical protein